MCRIEVARVVADHHLGTEHGQDLQQLLHAYRTRVALNVGDAGLHDAQALRKLRLGHVARLAQ